MISLFIDTALSYIRIALFKDDELIDFINDKCDKNMSAIFDCKVRDIFVRNGLDYNQVDKIYTVVGPGSFTGIRVGMTFSKVLAFSLNKKITPISELQVLASGCDSDLIAPLIDARRGYVYAGVYDSNLNIVVNEKHILLDDFINMNNNVFYVSYDSFEHISVIEPNINFEKLIIKNKDKEQVDHQVLTPNYLKMTEAEEKLLRKKNDN